MEKVPVYALIITFISFSSLCLAKAQTLEEWFKSLPKEQQYIMPKVQRDALVNWAKSTGKSYEKSMMMTPFTCDNDKCTSWGAITEGCEAAQGKTCTAFVIHAKEGKRATCTAKSGGSCFARIKI